MGLASLCSFSCWGGEGRLAGPDAGCAPCLTVARVWGKAGVCGGRFVIGISDLGACTHPVLQRLIIRECLSLPSTKLTSRTRRKDGK
jgi:hypothetical protein